jgi:hypothetical protein
MAELGMQLVTHIGAPAPQELNLGTEQCGLEHERLHQTIPHIRLVPSF